MKTHENHDKKAEENTLKKRSLDINQSKSKIDILIPHSKTHK